MNTARLGTIAWVAIYAGLAAIALGISLQRNGAGFGWGVTILGALAVGAGAVVIWVLSRTEDSP